MPYLADNTLNELPCDGSTMSSPCRALTRHALLRGSSRCSLMRMKTGDSIRTTSRSTSTRNPTVICRSALRYACVNHVGNVARAERSYNKLTMALASS